MNKNYKILLVCDDEAIRSAYLKSLAHISRNVEFVCDGDEAVAAIEQRTFDLVLLDVRTPTAAILRTVKLKSPDSEVVVVASPSELSGCKGSSAARRLRLRRQAGGTARGHRSFRRRVDPQTLGAPC